MNKKDVLEKLDEYAGRPIEVGLSDEGAMLYAGIDGHWLFTTSDYLVEIRKNVSDGTHAFCSAPQQELPFTITCINFDTVGYIRTMITSDPKDVELLTKELVPVGTKDSKEKIIKDIQTDSIYKANSPRGFSNNEHVEYSKGYGNFEGSLITTEKDGFPNYVNKLINK